MRSAGSFFELERYEPSLLRTSLPLDGGGAGAPPGKLLLSDALSCVKALREESDERVDLVYMDPPFATGSAREVTVTPGDGATGHLHLTAYEDPGDMGAYLERMSALLEELRELLSEAGSLVLHCDHRASPSLSMLLDEIFGPGDRRAGPPRPGFRNEVVWSYGLGGSSPRCYPKKHDTLLWYTKARRWHFEAPMTAATSARMRGLQKKLPDVWTDVPTLNNMAHERTGYPTQKPLRLLERVISAHSRPGDLVYDPFCGSGTTILAAERLGRAWIGSDSSELALHVTRKRLLAMPAPPPFSVLSHRTERRPAGGPRLVVSFEATRGGGLRAVLEGLELPPDDPLLPLSADDPLGSLRLVDAWAVDPCYDGVTVRPAWMASRDAAGALPSCSPELSGCGRVVVLAYDLLGRRLVVGV
jgi:hypothetical protein